VWPFVPAHLATTPHETLPSFDRAMDRFFSHVEGQKISMRAVAQVQAL
jgi:hypothetical protein